MSFPFVVITVAGAPLPGWDSMSLKRSKQDATGHLTVSIPFPAVPRLPVLTNVLSGKEITCYIGGHLAFTGIIDDREADNKKQRKHSDHNSGWKQTQGKGHAHSNSAPGITSHAGPNSYKISISARGKSKDLIDSSHDHKTGTKLGAKTRSTAEELVKNFGIKLDWRAGDYDLDKMRFRDGGAAIDELQRIGNENGFHIWENRDGTLRVQEGATGEFGEPLIVGVSITEFSTHRAEDSQNSSIDVKGHSTKKGARGKAAVNRRKKKKVKGVGRHRPMTIQHYGHGSDEALDRRARFEADKRAMASKGAEVTVFHVMPRTGGYWDIGKLHQTVIPSEGIFEVMECTGLHYYVDHEKVFKTVLTLNPPPGSAGSGAGAGLGGISGRAEGVGRSDEAAAGAALATQHGYEPKSGEYPDGWGTTELADVDPEADPEPTSPTDPPPLQIG